MNNNEATATRPAHGIMWVANRNVANPGYDKQWQGLCTCGFRCVTRRTRAAAQRAMDTHLEAEAAFAAAS